MSDTGAPRSPSAVQRAMAFESGIWRSLVRWVLRRPAVPAAAGVVPFTYHKMSTPVIWLWIFGSVVEVVAVHFLLHRWFAAQLVLDVLGLWGLAWMLGMLGSLRVHPHLLEDGGLRVRSGFSFDALVPWERIATVVTREHDLPSSLRSVVVEESADGDVLAIGVSGRTNVLVRLTAPTRFTTPRGEHEVTGVRLWADDRRELVAQVKAALR